MDLIAILMWYVGHNFRSNDSLMFASQAQNTSHLFDENMKLLNGSSETVSTVFSGLVSKLNSNLS